MGWPIDGIETYKPYTLLYKITVYIGLHITIQKYM